MNWHDNLLLLGDDGPGLSLRGQWQLAMYAIHLSAGHSIYCKQIKVATIEQYLLAAASFISQFTGNDCRKDNAADSHMGHILAPVLRDLKKCESIPNRREPYDPQMHALARRVASRFPPDSLVCALVDGFEQGFVAGNRLTEWAQPAGKSNPAQPLLSRYLVDPIRTRAFVPNDFRILTYTRHHAVGLQILRHSLPSIHKMWCKWRTQKNGQNGEEKLFTRNSNSGGHCFVASTHRALQRFQRIMVLDATIVPNATPLSIYWDPRSNSAKLINANDIERFMRRLACSVYHLHPSHQSTEVNRWSSHSLRVGACVALHAMGFSTVDIQWILRWRSTAFMVYLRNVAILSDRHTAALDRLAAHPFI